MRSLERRGKFFLLTLTLVLFSSLSSGYGQGEPMTRRFGLTGSLQGGQTTILVPLWLGDMFTLAPGFSIRWVDGGTTNIAVQVTPRLYLDMNRIATYITGTIGVMLNMPNAGANTTNLMLGIGLGGEYFINPKFSLGVEAGFMGMVNNINVSGARTSMLNSATSVNANVYF